MSGYGRTNTIVGSATSTAATALTAKLPNTATITGAFPGTKPVGATQRWRIKSVFASYGGALPVGATITITDGVFTIIAAAAALNPIDLQCAPGAEVDFTLTAGGTGVLGFISVIAEVE